MTPRPTQGGAPVRARTRGPVELTLEVAFGLIFVSLFAWFIGVMIELAGHYVLWKEEGALAHSQRIVAQDMGYIAAAPRSLLIDDTEGFAHRLNGWAAWPYERLGVLAWYSRTHAPGQEKAAPASQPKASAPQQLGLGLVFRMQALPPFLRKQLHSAQAGELLPCQIEMALAGRVHVQPRRLWEQVQGMQHPRHQIALAAVIGVAAAAEEIFNVAALSR